MTTRDDEPPVYRSTWLDRLGPEGGIRLQAARYALVVLALSLVLWGIVVRRKLEIHGWAGLVLIVVLALATAIASYRAGLATADAGGAAARAFTMPSGRSTPYEEQFSFQEALAARGDVRGALESFEAVIAERPDAAAPRLKAADLYARQGKDPRRAEALFREVRDLARATPREALYAAQRLVDLYEGPLDQPGRALVELRRLVELYPGTDVAAGARTAIARIKAARAEGQGTD